MSRFRIHISVQIPHQDGMLPLVSTMPLHNLHFLLSESIYRQQHVCSNLVTLKDLQGIAGQSHKHRPHSWKFHLQCICSVIRSTFEPFTVSRAHV